MCKPSIAYLELYAVIIAIELWAYRLANVRIIIFCDNQSVVEMINKAASPCKKCMVLICIITFTTIRFNICFFARYIRTADNNRADTLSRLQLDRFWHYSDKKTEPDPTDLSKKLWPVNKIRLN